MVGKKAVLMLVLLSLGLLAVTFQPAKSVKRATIDFEGLKAETFVYNVFLPLVSKDYEENNTVIDFEGLAEGKIYDSLIYGEGISGDPIAGNVSVFGSNPAFDGTNTAMIFDATCEGGCSGGDYDLEFPTLGNGLIISEDLDTSDPDDADNPGDFYFEFVFSNFGDAKVNVKKLTYADIDDNEAPGLIEVYKGSQLKKKMELPHTGNHNKEEVLVEANDIDRLVVRLNGSAMIDNVEIVIEPPNYNMTIGYEDLRFVSGSDFDYNDWVVSILTELQGVYVDEDTIELEKITFNMTPKARGAQLGHEFHFRFEAKTFESDGVAELVIQDIKEVPLITEKSRFDASVRRDFPIIFDISEQPNACDCEAFADHPESGKHNMRRTDEDSEEYNGPARRTAELSITFDTPVQFDLPSYGRHCQGLFFDPYLRVPIELSEPGKIDNPYDITRTMNVDDPNPERRILCVEDPGWLWPEERIRVDLAYPMVEWLDEPTFFKFPQEWDAIHNTCVFDGEPCRPE